MGLFAQEDDQFVLTVVGYGGHHPPTGDDGFLAFAANIAPAHIFAAVDDAEPLTAIRRHHSPTSRRRRYKRLRRLPDGLVVLGDGMCSLNPMYGQGMSVAALQAMALRDALAGGRDGLVDRYFAAASKPVNHAWQLTADVDRAILGLPRSWTARLISAYAGRLYAAAVENPVLTGQLLAVTGLLDPPAALLKPGVARRALSGARRQVRTLP